MVRPFSERVADAEWRREAETWIGGQLDRHGDTMTGPIEQPRVRPWSTQLTVPTTAGSLWFKANCAALAFEPRLHDELAALAPGSVDVPYATQPDRGWLLTRDRGSTLGDSHEPTIEDWRRVLGEAATLQRITATEADRLLATGMPDCSPPTVVDRFDRLVEVLAALPEHDPSHLDADLAARLRARRPAVVDAAQELEASSLPTTWQHGDLHPWNVFAVGRGSLRVFDFGDAQWAHATELLSVPYGWIAQRTVLPWGEVLEAYCDVWGVTPADLEPQWVASGLTQPVNRAMTWWGCLAEASAAELAEWGEAPLHHLSRVLDG
ncbi:phosphotransferase [Aeromicrobium sp. NPDC092404]|uniref:phosphotransferase n=1 Tax=Aeromicrobium sp. NPDC092404 TaxID=3154976 RepID=UPI00342C29EC